MKSFLACLFLTLLAIAASPASVDGQTKKSRGQPKDAKPKVIMSNFGNEEAVPDPSDAIAAAREWKDVTGEHSCRAQLQSVQAGNVALKKADGTVSNLLLAKLYKDDQELIRSFLMRNTLRQIKKAIDSYRQAELADTKQKSEEKRKAAEESLQKKINGRVIRLVFPITEVGDPEKGLSILTLGPPDMQADGWDYRTSAQMKFSKDTTSSNSLVVEGKALVTHIGTGTRGQATAHSFGNTDMDVLSYDDVQLTLDKFKMTVQRGQAKVAKATKSDVPAATADHGAIAKPAGVPAAGIPAATAPEAWTDPTTRSRSPNPRTRSPRRANGGIPTENIPSRPSCSPWTASLSLSRNKTVRWPRFPSRNCTKTIRNWFAAFSY